MRVLVCGGRKYYNLPYITKVLEPYTNKDDTVIIHGGAAGADWCAELIARRTNTPVLVFKADWEWHGKAAGPIRNKAMLEEGKPDLVIAFSGGRGTANMVKQAKAKGVEVIENV